MKSLSTMRSVLAALLATAVGAGAGAGLLYARGEGQATPATGMPASGMPASGMPPPPMEPHGDITRAEASAHAAQMFAQLDANHDGRIDAADRAARQAARFDRIDTNHDGQISRAEFMAMRDGPHGDGGPGGPGGPMGRPGMHDGAMRAMGGPDRDRPVGRAEFIATAMRRFDAADTNHDGRLSPAERHAERERMHAMMEGGPGDGPPPPPPSSPAN